MIDDPFATILTWPATNASEFCIARSFELYWFMASKTVGDTCGSFNWLISAIVLSAVIVLLHDLTPSKTRDPEYWYFQTVF